MEGCGGVSGRRMRRSLLSLCNKAVTKLRDAAQLLDIRRAPRPRRLEKRQHETRQKVIKTEEPRSRPLLYIESN